MQSRLVVIQEETCDTPDGRALFKAMYDDLSPLYGGDPEGTMRPIDFAALDGVFIVARIDGAAVGCAGIRRFDATTAEVKRVFVSQAARGQGISRALMLDLHTRATAMGYRRLVLETGAKQIAAMHLYESLGYTRIPCYGEYAGDPMSVCFEKQLIE